ncbi:MAG: hypothetical protein ABI865_05375, partial [Nitrosospira sp.]
YLTAISIVFSGQPRFHFPVMPWVIMYAAWSVGVLCMRVPSRSLRPESPLVAMAVNNNQLSEGSINSAKDILRVVGFQRHSIFIKQETISLASLGIPGDQIIE